MESTKEMKNNSSGFIPDNWRVVTLGDHASVLRGGSPRPIEAYLTKDPDGINWIKIGDVGVGAKYINQTEERIIPEGVSRSRKVFKGDFLLSNSMSFGRPYILNVDGCIHDGWLVIQEYYDSFTTDYLYYALSSQYVLEQYRSMAAGSSVLNLNKDIVKRVRILLPPKEEQKRIANTLSSMDTLIAELNLAIEKKRQIKEGLMQQLLTGTTRLPGFSGEWTERQLNQIGSMFAGGTPSTFNKEYWDGDICWLHSGAVQNCFVYPSDVQRKITSLGLRHSSARLIKADSIIVAITGATCANIGYLTFESAANQSIVAIEPTAEYDSKFLYYKLLKSREQILSHKGGSAQSGVSLHSLSSVYIYMPVEKKEQKAISDLLVAIDKEIIAYESERDKYRLIKQGMMQELLTGKTRLV